METERAAMSRVTATPLSAAVLSLSDRNTLDMPGHLQGAVVGHLLCVSYPECNIIAANVNVRSIPWIQNRDTHKASAPQSMQPTPEADNPVGGHHATIELLGTRLSSWIPADLVADIKEAMEGMIQAKSKQALHFFSYREESYAITLHTTDEHYTSLGVEVELVHKGGSLLSFQDRLISRGCLMEFYVDARVLKTACAGLFTIFDRRGLKATYHVRKWP
jgi:hypothetical protein